jgi:hypothetical protein
VSRFSAGALTQLANTAIDELRGGAGAPTAGLYAVLMINDDTNKALVIITCCAELQALEIAKMVDDAITGKSLGFRARCVAVSTVATLPPVIVTEELH